MCRSDTFAPQSGTTADNVIRLVSGDTTEQNVQFSQQTPAYMYTVDSEMDPTRMLQDSDVADLNNFFSRPIKIAEEQWNTNSDLDFDIDPWTLYFTNLRVINRITNYNLLRCRLHVRVLLNGNGFQYGRALAHYLPFFDQDDMSGAATTLSQNLIQASQQPHIFLNPTNSTGGDMILPFFFHKNYMSVVEEDWTKMGRLFFQSLNDLKHANGASDKVTITVFAWAEDVSLNVLTSEEPPSLAPQSGEETDVANRTGIVSGPATAVSQAALAISAIPKLRPFAMATSLAADGVANFAKYFGYSRPSVTKAPEPYRPTPTSSLALTNTPDVVQKLTVDEKQELSIDPRIAGLGSEDALNIKEIARRESYLTKFTWQVGDPPDTFLWNARVQPCMWDESAGLNAPALHLPASAMASLPFSYWTGSMRFRFQIVSSSFHKGRLRIAYDPNFLRTDEFNISYTTVIDLADKNDFTIEVGNGQPFTLLTHLRPGIDPVSQCFSTTPYFTDGAGNGVIGVSIVNELTVPNSTVNNDVEINVFVSMGDDFEVFVPNQEFSYYTFKPTPTFAGQLTGGDLDSDGKIPEDAVFQPQSGVEEMAVHHEEANAPQMEESDMDHLGPGLQSQDHLAMVYTGESIASFRTLLKRYNRFRAFGALGPGSTLTRNRWSSFPFYRGAVAGAVDSSAAGAYNFCNTTMLNYVQAAFQGWRGSIKWKILHNGQRNNSFPTTMWVERVPITESRDYWSTSDGYFWGGTTTQQVARRSVIANQTNPQNLCPAQGARGIAFAHSDVNPTLEFEVPYYNRFRFTRGKKINYTVAPQCEAFLLNTTQVGSVDTVYQALVAVGEDYQVYMFTGLPVMYYEPTAPPET